jgi:simple sugar transport system permease protein
MAMTAYEAILLTIITASTPLLIAALGELVTERSGVLNLGVEGMMAMGAVCSFAAAVTFDSTLIGVFCGMLAGVLMAALFALVVLGFAANQVGSGLALTILGLGLSGLIGAPFVGSRRDPVGALSIPGLSDLPVVGRILFQQDPFVYASLALTIGAGLYLARTRAGLTLRSVGENHTSAHGLGLPVLKTRLLAILFGGACAGLAGAYLSLVYTRFWSPGMTAGRGWIALALVVFAAWRPGWVLVGAYIFGAATVLQLHAQAAQWGIPSQALSALPYLATILALLLLSIRHGRAIGAPGSLGTPFVPDR